MPIPIKYAEKILASQRSKEMLNLFAQGNAKRLLIEVGEPVENFPKFATNLEDNTTASAYAILGGALSLYEHKHDDTSIAISDLV